jgi:glycosyltransferase involved in cell wall biosynthesis
MKILHISALPLWSMDGKGGMPSLLETVKGHVKAGHEIEMILPQYDLFSNDLEPIDTRNNPGIKIHIVKCPWLYPIKFLRKKIIKKHGNEIPYILRWIINLSIFKLLTISFFLKGLKIKKEFSPDLIYSHNQYSSMAGFLLGSLWEKPNVTRLYGTFLADLMKKPFVSLRYPTAAAGYFVPSNLLICANDGTRGDEVAEKFKINPKKFRFWQNGIKLPEKSVNIDKEEFIEKYGKNLKKDSIWIVSCSRLSSWKRIDRMLYALKYCVQKNTDCQLVIAGEGPEKKYLEKLAKEIGVSDYVVWLGSVAHDEIWSLMNIADIFMITNDVTNRCNPLYEAAWAGLPVVSVNDPSTKDLLTDGKNAFVSEKDNHEEMGKKLLKLCSDKDLRSKFGREQKKLSSQFKTWEERMKDECRELEKIVSAGKN